MTSHAYVIEKFREGSAFESAHTTMSTTRDTLSYYSQVIAWRLPHNPDRVILESYANSQTVRTSQALTKLHRAFRYATTVDSYIRHLMGVPLEVLDPVTYRVKVGPYGGYTYGVTRYTSYPRASADPPRERGAYYSTAAYYDTASRELLTFPYALLMRVFWELCLSETTSTHHTVWGWFPAHPKAWLSDVQAWLAFLVGDDVAEGVRARLERSPALMIPGAFLIGRRDLEGLRYPDVVKRAAPLLGDIKHKQHLTYRRSWNHADFPRTYAVRDADGAPVLLRLGDRAIRQALGVHKDRFLARAQHARVRWWEVVGWNQPLYSYDLLHANIRPAPRDLYAHHDAAYGGRLYEQGLHERWLARGGPAKAPTSLEKRDVLLRAYASMGVRREDVERSSHAEWSIKPSPGFLRRYSDTVLTPRQWSQLCRDFLRAASARPGDVVVPDVIAEDART